MMKTKTRSFPKKSDIRSWTLYVIRSTKNDYYVGIMAKKDFMKRINQHGNRSGAWWWRNKHTDELVEIHP
jgi:predicted GIY-YIG superfamily endonuclease